MNFEILISWLPLITSIVVVLLGYIFGRRKQNSDIVTETTKSVLSLIQPLNERIDGQACRITSLESIVKSQEEELVILRPLPQIVIAMTRGINILITQLRKNNIEPEWTPADLEPLMQKLGSKLKKE